MKADELRDYLKEHLGFKDEEVMKLKVREMRELVEADQEE